jgi:hypothetical protein
MNTGPLAAATGTANGTENAALVIATTTVRRSDFMAVILQVLVMLAAAWQVSR